MTREEQLKKEKEKCAEKLNAAEMALLTYDHASLDQKETAIAKRDRLHLTFHRLAGQESEAKRYSMLEQTARDLVQALDDGRLKLIPDGHRALIIDTNLRQALAILDADK